MFSKRELIAKKLIDGLETFAKDLENNNLDGYRFTRLTRQDDGTIKIIRKNPTKKHK